MGPDGCGVVDASIVQRDLVSRLGFVLGMTRRSAYLLFVSCQGTQYLFATVANLTEFSRRSRGFGVPFWRSAFVWRSTTETCLGATRVLPLPASPGAERSP